MIAITPACEGVSHRFPPHCQRVFRSVLQCGTSSRCPAAVIPGSRDRACARSPDLEQSFTTLRGLGFAPNGEAFLILSWAISQLLSSEGSQPGGREGTSITGHRDGDHSQIVPADEYFCPISQVAVGTEELYLFLLRPRKEVVYGSAVIPR